MVARLVAITGEDGDGQHVVEEDFFHPGVHVGRPFDEDVGGAKGTDRLLHHAGAGRAVMADADEGGRHGLGQPGKAWRASWNAFQCRPFLRGTCCSR